MAHMVLFHLGVLDSPPRTGGPIPYEERLAEVSAPLPAELVGYLEGSAEGLVESLTA
tara:strand:- start:631 stop:801 length:171 start_codon:yes stop_codon:yes gene_type:complete